MPLCKRRNSHSSKYTSGRKQNFCQMMRCQSCCPKCQFPLGQIHVQATLTLLGLCSISTNAKKLLLQILPNSCCITHLKMSWMHRDKVVNLDAVEFVNENTLNFSCNNRCQALIRNSYTSTNDLIAGSNGPISAS